jgi:hypothetical protein
MTSVRVALAGILSLCLLNGEASKATTIYDAAGDFSPTNNPNGVWSYGWSSTLGSAFNLDVTRQKSDGLDFWEGPVATPSEPGLFPYVSYDPTPGTITYGSTVHYALGQLGMHPGPQDQYSVIRFTAPHAGTYQLATSFYGLDFVGPTKTDVHVLVDGTPLFNGEVDGFGAGSGPSFTSNLTLLKGDTVDFAVGFGPRHAYFNDSTGITATLAVAIPEPASLVLLSMGVVGVGALAINRKNRC